jgi:hypothetical protein
VGPGGDERALVFQLPLEGAMGFLVDDHLFDGPPITDEA